MFLAARATDAEAEWDAAYRWVEQDPAHGYAFAKVEAGWALAAGLRGVGPERACLAAAATPAAIATVRHDRSPSVTRRRAIAGIAVGLTAAAGVLAWRFGDTETRFATAIGEHRAMTLADGSLMRLNTDTAVTVDLTRGSRSIRLLRGEASFDVAHDTMRPFVVAAGDTRVRAVGTAFTIRLRPDLTEVTVTEGIVGVRDGDRAERQVTAGNAAAVRRGTIAVTALGACRHPAPPGVAGRAVELRRRYAGTGGR